MAVVGEPHLHRSRLAVQVSRLPVDRHGNRHVARLGSPGPRRGGRERRRRRIWWRRDVLLVNLSGRDRRLEIGCVFDAADRGRQSRRGQRGGDNRGHRCSRVFRHRAQHQTAGHRATKDGHRRERTDLHAGPTYCVQPNGDSLRYEFRAYERRAAVTPAFRMGLRALLSGDLLTDKVAIVTGAGRGIGEGIARRLAQDGAIVVCADVNESEATSVAASLAGIGMRLDVSKADECDALVKNIHERYGRLDILVNNAGINRDAMLHKMTDEQWHQVIAVDLSGVFFMTRAASRIMRAAGAGRIVNISSASWMGNIGQANYAAAKAGVVGLSRTAAKELARSQVTVNAICPGFIDTTMTRGIPDAIREQQLAKIPLGRAGQPADVAAVVAFLASDEAGYITGEVINVGGGYVL